MATYHCSVKAGPKGKGASHASYISRDGKYGASDRYEDLEASGSGNMPAWAAHNSIHFWAAADEHERANGTVYREIEVALPRELTAEQRRDLVTDYIAQELGDRHAYQWAIHCPKAALEKGDQPHAHIMYSPRLIDDLARDPGQYFKRYNRKAPERGGCLKAISGTVSERRAEMIALRERWATVQNNHLARHGHGARVDHRRLEEQGIERVAERHLGGRGVRQLSQADTEALLDRRAAEREHETAQDDVNVIDLSAALDAAKKAKETAAEIAEFERLLNDAIAAAIEQAEIQRQQAKPTPSPRQEPVERELIANDLGDVRTPPEADTKEARLERMTIWELEAEIERIKPPDYKKAIARHPDMRAAQHAHDQLETHMNGLHERFLQAGREAVAWREAHPLRTKLHDSGIKPAAFLVERQHIQQASREEHIRLEPQWDESQATLDKVHSRVHFEVMTDYTPRYEQMAVLRQQLDEHRKIDLYPLLRANGAQLIPDQPDKAWFDPTEQVIHTPPPGVVLERASQQMAEAYATWRTATRQNLPETDQAAYQAALVNELGICTHLFRKPPDLPISPTTAAMARHDVQTMVKQLQAPSRSRHRSHSLERERSRGLDFGL